MSPAKVLHQPGQDHSDELAPRWLVAARVAALIIVLCIIVVCVGVSIGFGLARLAML